MRLILLGLALTCASLWAAEPTAAEREAQASASRGDWSQAGHHWEAAMLDADRKGEVDRTLANAEQAIQAWKKAGGERAPGGQIFALNVASKVDLHRGRLTDGRARNVEALRLVDAELVRTCGWHPAAGEAPPADASLVLLEHWARAQSLTAEWLDAQARTIEAARLLEDTERSMRAVSPEVTGFYHRKLLSARASLLKFLGFQEEAIAQLQSLIDLGPGSERLETAPRVNLPYYSSQFYGPQPEYLQAVRGLLDELQQSGSNTRELRRLLAKMAFAYREAGASIGDLESVIREAQAAGADLEAIYAQRDLLFIKVDQGQVQGAEEGFVKALDALRARGVKRGEPTLYREYGEFLVGQGRAAEGLRLLLTATRMTRQFGWTQHLPTLLAKVAAAQGVLGDHAGLERTLAEIDALLAGGELVAARHFYALCARVRVLLLLGRPADEALAAAIAFADRHGLNAFQRSALNWTKDVTPLPKFAPTQPSVVDLQPVAVLATIIPGTPSRARFSLTNPGAQAVEGTLTATGSGLTLRWDPASAVVTVISQESAEVAPASVALRVDAGAEVLVALEAAEIASPRGVQLRWQQEGQSANAVCHFRRETPSDTAETVVANTAIAKANPFYAVRLYHPVRVAGGPADFRVLPSRPCRIEVYDAHTGALLAVDANGDADFHGSGDSLAGDRDGTGFPELPVDAQTGLGEIEIYLYPLQTGAFAGDTRIELQVPAKPGWRSVAHDRLKSSTGP